MPDPRELVAAIAQAGGVAKPNRFRVTVNPLNAQTNFPIIFANSGISGSNAARRLQFFCDKAEFPGRAFSTSDVRHYGPTYKQPHQSQYSDVTLRFLVGDDMQEKYLFDAWTYAIEDPETQNISYAKEYVSDITIEQYTDNPANTPGLVSAVGGIIAGSIPQIPSIIQNGLNTASSILNQFGGNFTTYEATLIDAWPIGIGQLELDYAANDMPHRLSVSFAYRRWLNDVYNDASSLSQSGTTTVNKFKSLGI